MAYQLLLATRNRGKIEEFRRILEALAPGEIELLGLDAFPDTHDVIEDGATFTENALKKAREMSLATGIAAIADDSGLCIDALNGDPGIYSARWAGKNKDFRLAIKKVYSKLKKKKKLNKINSARFYCSLAIAFPNGMHKTFSGIVKGKISEKPKGNNGFGYDPIFIPNGYKKTFGEMKASLKDKISHRYKAFNKIKRYFKY